MNRLTKCIQVSPHFGRILPKSKLHNEFVRLMELSQMPSCLAKVCSTHTNAFRLYSHRYFSNSASRVCLKCKETVSNTSLFCSCGAILPLHSQNYFKILGIEQQFNVNAKRLTSTYRKLLTQLHPDKFGGLSEAEQQLSADNSSLVNEAYHTLNKPLTRALYMLDLAGKAVGEDDSPIMDQLFLMEVMEGNEAIEDASDLESLSKLDQKNKNQISELIIAVESAFSNDDVDLARELTLKLRYYVNMEEKIKERLFTL